jgi:hypothetical protein
MWLGIVGIFLLSYLLSLSLSRSLTVSFVFITMRTFSAIQFPRKNKIYNGYGASKSKRVRRWRKRILFWFSEVFPAYANMCVCAWILFLISVLFNSSVWWKFIAWKNSWAFFVKKKKKKKKNRNWTFRREGFCVLHKFCINFNA